MLPLGHDLHGRKGPGGEEAGSRWAAARQLHVFPQERGTWSQAQALGQSCDHGRAGAVLGAWQLAGGVAAAFLRYGARDEAWRRRSVC